MQKKRKLGAANIKKMPLLGGINDVNVSLCELQPCTNGLKIKCTAFIKTVSGHFDQSRTHYNLSQHYLFTCTDMYNDSDYSWGATLKPLPHQVQMTFAVA